MNYYVFFLLFFIYTPDVLADTPSRLSELAQERAPLIKIYVEQQNAAKISVQQAQKIGNPALTFQGGELRNSGENGRVMDFTLMQPFAWPGRKSAEIEQQKFLHQISKIDLQEIKLRLGHRVYLLAWELACLTEIEKHNLERRDRFKLITKYLNTRPLASPKQILEKDLILSQFRSVEKFMIEVSGNKRSLENELKLLTGLENLNVKVNWHKIPEAHEKSFYLTRYSGGVKFKRMKNELLISENMVESAKLSARPDIMLGVNYRKEDTTQFYHGQVSLVIPIFDQGDNLTQVARANQRKAEARSHLLEQEARSELIRFLEDHKTAREGLEIYPLSLQARSKERFKKAEEAFKKGQIDVTTFLQSDSQVHENIELIFYSRLEYLSSLSRLEEMVGHQMEQE